LNVEIRVESRKKKAGRARDGDDAAGRAVADGGKARTSPETGMARLAATSLT
jgi:hypothetical protein